MLGRRLTLVLSSIPVGCALGAALWLALGEGHPDSPFEVSPAAASATARFVRPFVELAEGVPAVTARIAVYFDPPEPPHAPGTVTHEPGMSIRLVATPPPKDAPSGRDP